MRTDRVSSRMRQSVISGVLLIVGLAGAASAQTAPTAQTMPWRPPVAAGAPFSTLNSVVEVNRFNALGNIVDWGSGSVFNKKITIDAAGNQVGWLCVLTADHVARGGAAADYRARFGDVAAQGSFGGANNLRFLGADPVINGGLGTVDIAVLGIRYGAPDAFFNAITPVELFTVDAAFATGQHMTQVAYGDTGPFVAANPAVPTPAGIRRDSRDSIKGFQNQEISGVDAAYTRGIYAFTSVEFTLDMPAAPDPMGNHDFLVAEGTSFPGDSGSPYFLSGFESQAVGAFARPGAGSDWPGGDMNLFSDKQFAVHSFGDGTPVGSVRPYGAVSGGVLLTQAYIDWINDKCQLVPTPATLSLMALSGLFAARRRRD